jgi:hypothetical protein
MKNTEFVLSDTAIAPVTAVGHITYGNVTLHTSALFVLE